MNTAFEVTVDDVITVLNNHDVKVSLELAQQIFNDYVVPAADEIEAAALFGNDMDEQTDYAHSEIAIILRSADLI